MRTIEARVHGRYLVRLPDSPRPWPALISFHGYGELADASLAALERVREATGWLCVAVQALHPFYTKDQRIVASWMTRLDREHALADNIRYVADVVAAVQDEFRVDSPVVFVGFSQGGAMAYRAAANVRSAGVIVLAADVPPDVSAPLKLPPVLIGRGRGDTWYTDEKMTLDVARLNGICPRVETCVFDGGHEWTDDFAAAAGAFLGRIRRER